MKIRLLPLLALLAFVPPLSATNRIYFGPDNGNWNLAANWSPNGTPIGGVAGAGDDIFPARPSVVWPAMRAACSSAAAT